MTLTLDLNSMRAVGHGLMRPEDVAVTRDGRAYASDCNAAISEVLPGGGLRLIGHAGHEPNGINLTADGTAMVIANFSGHVLQRCDLATGQVSVICDRVGDRELRYPNYPIIARNGSIYCSSSTQSDDVFTAVLLGNPDGYIFRITPAGVPELLVDGVRFPNGLALDADESYLYTCRTGHSDVVRFAIRADGSLGPEESYGPPVGHRSEWGEAAAAAVWGDRAREWANVDESVMYRWAFTDGCAFDVEGNLWVAVPGTLTAGGARIVAITPQQDMITLLDDRSGTLMTHSTNVSFGGPDLQDVYFGSIASNYVVKGRTPVPGLALACQ